MDNFIQQLQFLVFSIQLNAAYLGLFIGGLWLIHLLNAISGYRLNQLGIYPRRASGLIGIVTSPLLHGNINHLLFNSIPLLILANFILLNGRQTFLIVTAAIMLGGGLAVWLIGRKALHIGASGLIMGYWGYLVIDAYQNPSLTGVCLLILCFYYFGGFISSLLPSNGTSWEGHVFGLVAGVASYYFPVVPLVSQYLS